METGLERIKIKSAHPSGHIVYNINSILNGNMAQQHLKGNNAILSLKELQNNYKIIHYFGLGFIQLKINDDVRYHFYTKELPSILPKEEIHNHRYNFTSEILKGSLHYAYYNIVYGIGDYFINSVSCAPNNSAPNDKEKCEIILSSKGIYDKGSFYYLDKNTFHHVWAEQDTITKITRETNKIEFAKAIRHKDNYEICPFSKQIPEKDLWNIIEKMIKVN